jgi:hypothetical protein
MNTPHTPSAGEYQQLLVNRGLTANEARAWSILRHGPGPTTPIVLGIPDEYRNAGHTDPQEAVEWFLLGINAPRALEQSRRGWTPRRLIDLRQAIYDTHNKPRPGNDHPLKRQPHEADWIHTAITPELVPLYVRAGQQPTTAEELDKRRRDGDTTIEQALTTVAALRDARRS